MTCARRPAGAHRPAPSAGSSRPESRTGRRGARLSALLPAQELPLGELDPFSAASAQAHNTPFWSATLRLIEPIQSDPDVVGDELPVDRGLNSVPGRLLVRVSRFDD